MSNTDSKISKEERREISEFLPYLLSYSVDSLKHQQRNIEVQIEDLKKDFSQDLSSDIQHIISNITLYKNLSSEIPQMRDMNNNLTDLMKELEKKCEFTEMSKLSADKAIHAKSQQHLDDILEIARLPTTVNTLIHKNDSTMAMKLINHFNTEIYDPSSEILNLVKTELKILENKIQQKLNIQIEEGSPTLNETELLLGSSPSKSQIEDYIHKKYTIKK